jgi:hypothetical protein
LTTFVGTKTAPFTQRQSFYTARGLISSGFGLPSDGLVPFATFVPAGGASLVAFVPSEGTASWEKATPGRSKVVRKTKDRIRQEIYQIGFMGEK